MYISPEKMPINRDRATTARSHGSSAGRFRWFLLDVCLLLSLAATSLHSPAKSFFGKSTVKTTATVSSVGGKSVLADGMSFVTPSGVASTWELLPDHMLELYFTSAEISALKTKTCKDESNPWLVGPCCPNGHIYGWMSLPLNDTNPLRKREVRDNGDQMPPFQIHVLMDALQATKGAKSDYIISMYGDSTCRQLFFGMLCAFIRVGGAVSTCTTSDKTKHYGHPFCKTNNNQLAGMTTAQVHFNVSKQNADPTTDNIGQQQLITYHIRFHHDEQTPFSGPTSNGVNFIGFYASSLPPDVFLYNYGLHAKNEQQLEEKLNKTMSLFLEQSSIPNRSIIWRDTTLQHFPGQSGSFEDYVAARVHGNGHLAVRCADIENKVDNLSSSSGIFRRDTPRKWFAKHAPHVPILVLDEMEQHYYETYPTPRLKADGIPIKLDCTHHVYTPLYYDAFIRRLAETLLLQKDSNGRTK